MSDVFTTKEVLVSHPNARLTVRGRQLIIERAHAGWKQAHIAAAMGVSRRCVRRWLDRYAAEGAAGLHDRSSRPHHSPRRTAPSLEAAVVYPLEKGATALDFAFAVVLLELNPHLFRSGFLEFHLPSGVRNRAAERDAVTLDNDPHRPPVGVEGLRIAL